MPHPAVFSARDYLCALLVVVIWGTNFVVMKIGLQTLTPMTLGALRFAAASLPFLLFVRRPAVPVTLVLIYGLAQGTGQFGFLFTAIHLGMPAGVASLVIQTQAFFTLLLAAGLLGESARVHHLLGLLIAGSGLAVIAAAGGEGASATPLIGFVFTLCAAFMWAVSNLLVKIASRRAPGYDPVAFIVWSSVAPAVAFLGACVVVDGPARTWSIYAHMGWAGLLSALYLGVFATLLAYSLWTRLLMRHAAGRVAPFSLLVPVIGLAAAAWWFDEHLTAMQWWGALAVLAGLLVNQFGPGLIRSVGKRLEK